MRTRGVEDNIAAGFAAPGLPNGNPIVEDTAALSKTRDEAVAQTAIKATALNGNAVVAVRFDHASVGHDMIETVAYGTTVVVEPTP